MSDNYSNLGLPKYWCRRCEGNGYVQSEDGGETIKCPKCEGTGKFNPYKN